MAKDQADILAKNTYYATLVMCVLFIVYVAVFIW